MNNENEFYLIYNLCVMKLFVYGYLCFIFNGFDEYVVVDWKLLWISIYVVKWKKKVIIDDYEEFE